MKPEINLFGHYFSTYTLMALIGSIAAMVYVFFISIKLRISFKNNMIFLLYGVPTGFLGGILLYLLTQTSNIIKVSSFYFSDFQYFINSVGFGLVYYGGLIGFLCGLAIYAKLNKSDCRILLYYMTPAIPLFHCFGRIGCYFAGCCYGKNNIPIQLIEALFNCIIFITLCLFIRKKRKAFSSLGLYFLSYGVIRFILEFFRGDAERGILFGLSTSQWISILIIIPLGIYNLCAENEKNHFNKWLNREKS